MTENQKRFADEYLIDLNATRAYKSAYPNVTNEDSARKAGSRLLTNVDILNYIHERIRERQKRTEITQDMVVEELASIAFAKATDYVEIKGGRVCIKDTNLLSDAQIRAIAGIKEGANGIEIKVNDKEKALELLGRHLGMFKDKVEVSGLAEGQSKLSELLEQRRMRRDAK